MDLGSSIQVWNLDQIDKAASIDRSLGGEKTIFTMYLPIDPYTKHFGFTIQIRGLIFKKKYKKMYVTFVIGDSSFTQPLDFTEDNRQPWRYRSSAVGDAADVCDRVDQLPLFLYSRGWSSTQ